MGEKLASREYFLTFFLSNYIMAAKVFMPCLCMFTQKDLSSSSSPLKWLFVNILARLPHKLSEYFPNLNANTESRPFQIGVMMVLSGGGGGVWDGRRARGRKGGRGVERLK